MQHFKKWVEKEKATTVYRVALIIYCSFLSIIGVQTVFGLRPNHP